MMRKIFASASASPSSSPSVDLSNGPIRDEGPTFAEDGSGPDGRWLHEKQVTHVDIGLGVGAFLWLAISPLRTGLQDRDVLNKVTRSRLYAHAFLGLPLETGGDRDPESGRALHASWFADAISARNFREIDSGEGFELVRSWYKDLLVESSTRGPSQDDSVWVDEIVASTLSSGTIYKFMEPDESSARHDLGSVDLEGYVEFAIIDHERNRVTLMILACD